MVCLLALDHSVICGFIRDLAVKRIVAKAYLGCRVGRQFSFFAADPYVGFAAVADLIFGNVDVLNKSNLDSVMR
jgi:hypothetical protein